MFRAKLFTRVYCSECELHSLRVLSDMDPRERKPQVISGGGGGVHPLHPPPRSAPAIAG